jgi:hypothetical protein
MEDNEDAGTCDAHGKILLYFIQKALEKDITSEI